jgi:protein tyrosine phosphatase (PTP) superfamily phosphohydrolase (DUF442 family)
MASSTLKTVVGFVKSVFKRWVPVGSDSTSIRDIYNFLPIENLYATSGQPSERQFDLIHSAGYETVINLAPTSMLENSVVNEREILSALGINYIHIPVDFKNPTEDDFTQFVQSVRENADQKVWVHCAANMRVSAFTYRYRRAVLGVEEASAVSDLQKIWNPVGVWKKFISP